MRSKTFIFACTALFFIVAGCSSKGSLYDASGVFEATEILVSSEAGGRLMDFRAEEGMILEEGISVGYVDSLQLYLKKKQLEASLKAVDNRKPDIEKQIASINQQLITAKREKQRFENLISRQAANTKQLDDINASIALLEKQKEAQQSSLSLTTRSVDQEAMSIFYQIEQLKDQLFKSNIINPVRGTVLNKYVEKGEFVTPGKPLYKIADLETIFLRAYITSDQFSQVKTGEKVRVFSDEEGGAYREYEGEISWIAGQAEFTPKTIQTKEERANLVYAVKIRVKNDGLLKIGQYGEVIFSSAKSSAL